MKTVKIVIVLLMVGFFGEVRGQEISDANKLSSYTQIVEYFEIYKKSPLPKDKETIDWIDCKKILPSHCSHLNSNEVILHNLYYHPLIKDIFHILNYSKFNPTTLENEINLWMVISNNNRAIYSSFDYNVLLRILYHIDENKYYAIYGNEKNLKHGIIDLSSNETIADLGKIDINYVLAFGPNGPKDNRNNEPISMNKIELIDNLTSYRLVTKDFEPGNILYSFAKTEREKAIMRSYDIKYQEEKEKEKERINQLNYKVSSSSGDYNYNTNSSSNNSQNKKEVINISKSDNSVHIEFREYETRSCGSGVNAVIYHVYKNNK